MAKWIFFLFVLFTPFIALAAQEPCFDARHASLGDNILQMPGMRAWTWQAIRDQVDAYAEPEARAAIYIAPRWVQLAYFGDFQGQCRRLVKAQKKGTKSKAETPVALYVMSIIRKEARLRGLDPAAVLAAMFKQLMEE